MQMPVRDAIGTHWAYYSFFDLFVKFSIRVRLPVLQFSLYLWTNASAFVYGECMAAGQTSPASGTSSDATQGEEAHNQALLDRTVEFSATQAQRGHSGFLLGSEGEKIQFLLKASEILSSSLDYETTLKSVADLVVPRLAEWCTVHLQEKDGSIERVALAHADPKMIVFAEELNKRYPSDYSAPQGIGQVLRTGKAEMMAEITDEMLVKGAKDEEHLRITRSLKLGSYMAVPLKARGRTLGVLSFLSIAGRHYAEADLAFAGSLGLRCGLAVDNARLYFELQELNQGLEQKVQVRTEELRHAQEQDRSNLHRLKTMLANLPIAALMTDAHGHIIELNQEYCHLFNWHIRFASPKEKS